MKIPFIEHRVEYSRSISKLFNLIVNFYQLNNPNDVGMCTKIYTDFFSSAKSDYTFQEVVEHYLNHKPDLKSVLKRNSDKMEIEVLDFLLKLKSELKKEKNIFTRLAFNYNVDRNMQYKNILFKAYSLLYKENRDVTISLLKTWLKDIESNSIDYIRKESKMYFFQLLTTESIIGTSIENSILKYLSKKLPTYKSNNYLEKNNVDAIINGNFVSIKSIKYRISHYGTTSAKKNFNPFILEYEVKGTEWFFRNEGFVLSILSKPGNENTTGLRRI